MVRTEHILTRIKIFLWRIFYPARYDAYVIWRYRSNKAFRELILNEYAELVGYEYTIPLDRIYSIGEE
jgi:hypothetical protein